MKALGFRRLAWATDIHLNFCDDIGPFVRAVLEEHPDALLLGGDIAEAPTLEATLLALEAALGIPIFFVLGNHDFYHGSIDVVHSRMHELHESSRLLHWLAETGVVELSNDTTLVGHGGWADGRYGDYAGSGVRLSDFRLIKDLMGLDSVERLETMQRLAADGAKYIAEVLPQALERSRRVMVLTHVPPFQEASWYQGRMSDRFYLPHFASKAMGDVLLELASRFPQTDILVLCGHTHGSGSVTVLPNLKVITGGAEYGAPAVQRVFTMDGAVEEEANAGAG